MVCHGAEAFTSTAVFQDSQEKETVIPERAEEAKLKAKYPNLGQKPGGSDFLMKRLQKGVLIAQLWAPCSPCSGAGVSRQHSQHHRAVGAALCPPLVLALPHPPAPALQILLTALSAFSRRTAPELSASPHQATFSAQSGTLPALPSLLGTGEPSTEPRAPIVPSPRQSRGEEHCPALLAMFWALHPGSHWPFWPIGHTAGLWPLGHLSPSL